MSILFCPPNLSCGRWVRPPRRTTATPQKYCCRSVDKVNFLHYRMYSIFYHKFGFFFKTFVIKIDYILQWKIDFLFHNFFLKKVFCGISYIYICLLMTKSWMRNDNAISCKKPQSKLKLFYNKFWQKQAHQGTWKMSILFCPPTLSCGRWVRPPRRTTATPQKYCCRSVDKVNFLHCRMIQFFITNLGFSSKHLWSKLTTFCSEK
jgi:hypothetical protein